jgi:RPA family protein
MIHYFNSQTGLPVTPNVDAGEALVKQGLAIKKEDVPADVETWRLTVDVDTGALTVFAEGKQEADALLDKAEKDIAQAEADEVKNQADMKAQADAQKAAGTP